tara:strand:+ start:897 stop:1457 length:561 start_codon:yes stop_codon:yes gene_type:complete
MELIKDDKYDTYFLTTCHVLINHKTVLIPISIILPTLNFLNVFNNFIYLFLSTSFSLLILTWNFPYLSHVSYDKPVYYDDLVKNDLKNYEYKKNIIYNLETSNKFRHKFIFMQQIIFSFTLAILVEYITLKYKNTKLLSTEFLGILGGLISLYFKIIKITGKVILIVLYKLKKKERDRILNRQLVL